MERRENELRSEMEAAMAKEHQLARAKEDMKTKAKEDQLAKAHQDVIAQMREAMLEARGGSKVGTGGERERLVFACFSENAVFLVVLLLTKLANLNNTLGTLEILSQIREFVPQVG